MLKRTAESEKLTTLPLETQVTVIDGPVETSDGRWWKVRTNDGIEGWAIHAIDGEYVLTFVSAAEFAIEDEVRVYVTSGDTLNYRDEPSTTGRIVQPLYRGTNLIITNGPG